MVDMGIAMSHWDLAAAELGIKCRWVIEKPDGFPDEPAYIVSTIIE
jgi:hypothetical protein